jgi:hypothetical protein
MKARQARPPAYIADLFEAERAAPPPGPDVQDRVRARVAATVIASSAVGAATTASAATKGAGAAVLTSAAAKTSLVVLAVATVGTTGAVAVHRQRVRTQAPAVVAVRAAEPHRAPVPPRAEPLAPATAEPAAQEVAPPPFVAPPVEVAAVRPAVRPLRRADASSESPPTDERAAPTSAGLADENAFIEAARAALSAGEPARAAALLAHHARIHPRGQMEEEREALWVQALAAAGDGPAARARADAFRRRFPRSIQLGVVAAALETIP